MSLPAVVRKEMKDVDFMFLDMTMEPITVVNLVSFDDDDEEELEFAVVGMFANLYEGSLYDGLGLVKKSLISIPKVCVVTEISSDIHKIIASQFPGTIIKVSAYHIMRIACSRLNLNLDKAKVFIDWFEMRRQSEKDHEPIPKQDSEQLKPIKQAIEFVEATRHLWTHYGLYSMDADEVFALLCNPDPISIQEGKWRSCLGTEG